VMKEVPAVGYEEADSNKLRRPGDPTRSTKRQTEED